MEYGTIIVGAGLSGILMSKYLTQNNIEHIVLEKRNVLGGIWAYSDNENITTVSKKTIMSSSAGVSFFSDFPFPKSYPHFPHSSEYYSYLKEYVKKFNIEKNIIYGINIKKIIKVEGQHEISTDSGDVYKCTNLIICTGLHNKKNNIFKKKYPDYNGELLHSQQIKFNKPYCKKTDKVLIYGGGETAADLAMESYTKSSKVFWCIPRGMWCFKRVAAERPLDEFVSIQRFEKYPYNGKITHERNTQVTGISGNDVKEFDAKVPYYHKYLVKSCEPIIKIHQGDIIAKREIKDCTDKTFTFDDKTKHDVDVVIDCTGYTHDPIFKLKDKTLCKSCIDIDDNTLFYIGFCRPIIGSLMWVAELQAILVSMIVSKKLNITKEDMLKIIKKDEKYYKNLFGKNKNYKRINIVDLHQEYFPSMMRLIGRPLPKHNPNGTLEERILTKCTMTPALIHHNSEKKDYCLEMCKQYCKLIHYDDDSEPIFKTNKIELDFKVNTFHKFIFKNRRLERIHNNFPCLTDKIAKDGISFPTNYPWTKREDICILESTIYEKFFVFSILSLFTFSYLKLLPSSIKQKIKIHHVIIIVLSWIVFQNVYSTFKLKNKIQYTSIGALHGISLSVLFGFLIPEIPNFYKNSLNFNDTTLFKTIISPSLYSAIYFLIYPLMSKTQHIIRLK
jgi:dimethylaniline monooxygenase (N-oxide forming)